MAPRSPATPAPAPLPPADDLLESWKEIAAYLRRDVRTMVRWEATRGLPVHRLPGGARRAVYARKSEIEAWRANAERHRKVAPSTPPASIAVLPFANFSDDKDNEYFADGLADEILTLLAGTPGLLVTARTSSFCFRGPNADVREVGARLGVATLLEGSVRRAGNRIRVTVQLVETGSGYHLWAQQFDRSASDLFTIQDEIAEGVVRNLALRLGPASASVRHRQPSLEAFDWYLKGRYFLARRGPVERAVECFERAIAIQPDMAKAHLGIAEAFCVLALWELIPPAVGYARVRAAASRALELDDSIGAAHSALASVLTLFDRDWEGARGHFRRAESLPTEGSEPIGLGMYYVLEGRPDDALRYSERMLQRDPLSAMARTQAAAARIGLGLHDAARPLLEESFDLDSQVPMTLSFLGFSRGLQGRRDEALPLLDAAAERGVALALAHMVAILARAGALDRAQAAHARLEQVAAARHVSRACLALSHAALGHEDRCIELMTEADRQRSSLYAMLLIGPGYLALAPSWLQRWFGVRRREAGLPEVEPT